MFAAVTSTKRLVLLALSIVVLTTTPAAQGGFVNFESPPVEPLAIARIDDHDYLLVCNTPDNSVEIYDTIDMSFVQRVRVGLRPVTVVWHPFFGRFYTANFLGDSVTQVRFKAPGPGQTPVARVERTTVVGDEPTDIEFVPDGTSYFVTLNNRSAMGWYDGIFHWPVVPGVTERLDLTYPMFSPSATIGLKEPRRVILAGPVLIALGHKGGNNPTGYDFDLMVWNLGTGYHAPVGELGSTNFNFEYGVDGRLYTVGLFARNELPGADAVRQAATGFTESRLWVLDNVGSAAMQNRSRDLNRDPSFQVVPRTSAVTYPTDVGLLESGADVTKVFVAGMGSDRIGVLHNPLDGSSVESWLMTHINLPNVRAGYARTGPRNIQMKSPAGVAGDPGARLYVFSWLNHSIAAIDPVTEQVVQTVPLQNDPNPPKVRLGREFMYSTELSGNGFASCACCHIDGRGDFLAWDLGDPAGGNGQRVDQTMLDGTTASYFNRDKGRIVTQSVQGMMQHPAEGFARTLLLNAPFHWRGDQSDLKAFNGAYVDLHGMPNIGTPETPKGISDADMLAFEAYMETIMYGPNPDQNLDRILSGAFGDPLDETSGSGAARGLKLYHTRTAISGRSCAHCHALPSGTNRRISQTEGNPTFYSAQPLVTPQMMGLLQREGLVESPTLLPNVTRTSDFGLSRRGVRGTSIRRLTEAFRSTLPGTDFDDMVAFQQQFDWGIAPVVGHALTIDIVNRASGSVQATLAVFEDQVERGSAGLAVHALHGGTEQTYWYDATLAPPAYRQFGSAATKTRAELIAFVVASIDRVVFQATEAGSERRWAAPNGVPPILRGPAPTNITLEPMIAEAHWAQLPQVTKNWIKGVGTNDFNYTGIEPVTGRPLPDPVFLRAKRIYQQALISEAPSLGISQPSHDAPRRIQISGDGIRPGAKLQLHVPVDAPPPVNQTPQTQVIELPLFPTARRSGSGRPIWTTSAELMQFFTLQLLCGGPFAPGVSDARHGLVVEPPPQGTFDILTWNKYRVDIENADGSSGSGGWQSLRIQ